MKITIKTAGLLGKYLPPGGGANLAELEVTDGATPIDVMKQLGMPMEANYLVALNGSVVRKDDRATQTLTENDQLAIMPPLKGG